jgi:pSer/pThr/pTyr-binding forkhead associated (FHA) protein
MTETRACGVCGAIVTTAYCPQCGSSSETPEGNLGYDTRAAPKRPAGESTTLFQPRLLGEEGDPDLVAPADLGYLSPEGSPDQRIPLFGERTTFGRHSADVNLPDPAMSSPHFELTRAAGAYFLRDLDSASGTHLNERVIRSCELAPGDVIRAGTTHLVFRQDRDDAGD